MLKSTSFVFTQLIRYLTMQPKNFIEIADFLRIDSIKKDINSLSPNDNAELFIPLVGEFNAGTTSLLNALLKSCHKACFEDLINPIVTMINNTNNDIDKKEEYIKSLTSDILSLELKKS